MFYLMQSTIYQSTLHNYCFFYVVFLNMHSPYQAELMAKKTTILLIAFFFYNKDWIKSYKGGIGLPAGKP